ncbi:hypothetical protein ACFY3M_36180 [Streptomyces mirabilis]|uniref:hypothetical protein n=1 Tax=Streptomyces mirabilis TaxID=68239 RepID=UPI00369F38A5
MLLYPLVLAATFGDRLWIPLGLPGTSEPMKAAWHRWAQALFRSRERESGPLAEEAFPADWSAMTEFALEFESRSYEQTDSGHRVAIVMMDVFSRRWFPAPLRAFGNYLTRYLAGERVCRLHRIGWISPRREWVVRAFLKTAFRVQRVLPDYGKPLPERLPRRRDPESADRPGRGGRCHVDLHLRVSELWPKMPVLRRCARMERWLPGGQGRGPLVRPSTSVAGTAMSTAA